MLLWEKRAERQSQYLTKGQLFLVEGRLQADKATGGPRLFQRQDGSSSAQFEITAENIRLLGGKREEGNSSQAAHEAEEETSIPF